MMYVLIKMIIYRRLIEANQTQTYADSFNLITYLTCLGRLTREFSHIPIL